MQIAIDFFHPVLNIGQICCETFCERKEFRLSAPSTAGLYMLWFRTDMQYSLTDAENNYPKSYDGCASWLDNFICWIRVDENVTENKAIGDMVWLTPDGTPAPISQMADKEETGDY
jgi:hypothetical protein